MDWNEADHPRDEDGKFSGGGSVIGAFGQKLGVKMQVFISGAGGKIRNVWGKDISSQSAVTHKPIGGIVNTRGQQLNVFGKKI